MTKRHSVDYTVYGDGSSIWGPSLLTYEIRCIYLGYMNDECNFGELLCFGPLTKSCQYTDRGIVSDMNQPEILYDICHNKLNLKNPSRWSVCWSESGMQPKDGWSFDLIKELNLYSRITESVDAYDTNDLYFPIIGKRQYGTF